MINDVKGLSEVDKQGTDRALVIIRTCCDTMLLLSAAIYNNIKIVYHFVVLTLQCFDTLGRAFSLRKVPLQHFSKITFVHQPRLVQLSIN